MIDDPLPDDPMLALAEQVSRCAAILVRCTTEKADPARAAAIVEALATSPEGTRNCDMMLALSVAVAIQAKLAADETGVSLITGISIIASALGILAQRAHVVEMPSASDHIH